jgi:hypothetical protein
VTVGSGAGRRHTVHRRRSYIRGAYRRRLRGEGGDSPHPAAGVHEIVGAQVAMAGCLPGPGASLPDGSIVRLKLAVYATDGSFASDVPAAVAIATHWLQQAGKPVEAPTEPVPVRCNHRPGGPSSTHIDNLSEAKLIG